MVGTEKLKATFEGKKMKSFQANVPTEVRIFDQPVTTGLESSMRPPLFYFPAM